MYDQLPLLPKDLAVVILRPRGTESVERMDRQFRRRFRVRRHAVEAWLRFLQRYHRGYQDFSFNEDNLSQLPEDGDIYDQLNIHEVDESAEVQGADFGPATQGDAAEEGEIDDTVDEAAVPNLLVEESELQQLQGQAENAEQNNYDRVPLESAHLPANQLPMPSVRRTPLDEFNKSQRLLSLACPTLYPRGAADFVETRQREISYQDYITHAMKWDDGRFAKHHTFRFIALNTLMRQQAHSHSRYFVKKSDAGTFTKEELREALINPDTPHAQALLNKVCRCASALKGTRPFWYRLRRQLEAFAPFLGVPSAFITLSPADYHWDSLYRHMPEYAAWRAADDDKQRMSRSHRLLRENPHIAAWHFHARNKLFVNVVLKKKFNLMDYWFRYEWQGRGSSHSHGLFWFDGNPQVDLLSATSREEFAKAWGRHVTALNPNSAQGADHGNPLSVVPLDTSAT